MNAKQSLQENNAEMDRLKAENAKLRQAAKREFELKVSEKGCVSLYGHGGRFPVSLYPEQWDFVLGKAESIAAFIKANSTTLKFKPALVTS